MYEYCTSALPDFGAQLYYKAQSHYWTKSEITERIKVLPSGASQDYTKIFAAIMKGGKTTKHIQ